MNDNLFYAMTLKYSNINFSLNESLQYLQKIYNNLKLIEDSYDFINYEKLIFIDVHYSDNEDIIFYLKKIKEAIAQTWINKQKVIGRLQN